jgi:DNA-directed RNA polymerase specialized sigma24 family protein
MWDLISATLSPLETRVMTLHYGHDVPLAEITGQLALSNPSGAKAYIVSARRKLQGALRQRALELAG